MAKSRGFAHWNSTADFDWALDMMLWLRAWSTISGKSVTNPMRMVETGVIVDDFGSEGGCFGAGAVGNIEV